jgi:4'-phosphopantetheinyl transferase
MNIYWLEQAEADVPGHDEWLSRSEVLHLSRLRVPKRRADWRLGRWTAKHAVAVHLQSPENDAFLRGIEILAAPSGAPQVQLRNGAAAPSISLTHRAGVAACVVTPSDDALGCDLELIESHGDAFVADYFTTEEQRMVAATTAAERNKLETTLWSAKESALKALRLGLRVDTRCVAITLGADWPNRGKEPHSVDIRPVLTVCPTDEWYPLQARYNNDQLLYGWWQCSPKLARTVATFRPSEPPIFLTTPQLGESLLRTARQLGT